MPFSISIEPTTACNLACPECPAGLKKFTRNTGNINEEFFRKTIDQFAGSMLYFSFYFQGEPYIHPEFFSMVSYAHAKKIYTATSTNAHFLNDELAKQTVASGLDRLIISVDGTTQESYQSYRINGSLEKVIDGTKNLVKWKKQLHSKTPYLIIQFVVFKQNEHQMEEIKNLGKTLGIDEVKIKTAQFYNYSGGNARMPDRKDFSRYKREGEKYLSPGWNLPYCWKMWHSCVISWDGLVLPCCFDKDGNHILGDLKKDSFEKIWNGRQYLDFRNLLLKGRKKIAMCSNCSEGARVWV